MTENKKGSLRLRMEGILEEILKANKFGVMGKVELSTRISLLMEQSLDSLDIKNKVLRIQGKIVWIHNQNRKLKKAIGKGVKV